MMASAHLSGFKSVQAMVSDVLTGEHITQVDLVAQGVAQLNTHKLAVPRTLDVLPPGTVGEPVRLEGELGPDGVFT